MPLAPQFRIRRALDSDSAALIQLIANAYAAYPGCVLDVDLEEPDLRAIASAYARRGGDFWVALDETNHAAIVGCIGWAPLPTRDRIELRKLYVAAACRRNGLATKLLAFVLAAAKQQGAFGVELWSDTRFLEGHQFYRANGFEQQPETRRLFDLSNSTEYRFVKQLG